MSSFTEQNDSHGQSRVTFQPDTINPRDSLAVQDLSKLDVSTLTPLTPEVISRQATINIGTIGHVAHGKSTIVKAISGTSTIKSSKELIRNITIKLGYANAKIYKARGSTPNTPGSYTSRGSAHPDEFVENGKTWELVRHLSFVDCPGHDILMATMLNGAAVMDAALLLIAGNETCPQPQTSEHLAAVEIMQLKNIIILQNKVDLVRPDQALEQKEHIKAFVAGTVADSSPILPISAVHKSNVDIVCEYLATLPVPRRDFTSLPRMIVIRSFDINKPGESISHLKGGVAGGSILQGILRLGDEIEIRPGVITKDASGRVSCQPILTRISSLQAEKNDLSYAVPGGLIAVGTNMDPSLTRADRLIGQVLGLRGHLPSVFSEIDISYYLLRRLLGVKTEEGKRQAKVSKLSKKETLMLNIGSTSSGGTVSKVMEGESGETLARIQLNQPVCSVEGEKIALSRRVEGNWRLIGWGEIRKGKKIELNSWVELEGESGVGGGGGGEEEEVEEEGGKEEKKKVKKEKKEKKTEGEEEEKVGGEEEEGKEEKKKAKKEKKEKKEEEGGEEGEKKDKKKKSSK